MQQVRASTAAKRIWVSAGKVTADDDSVDAITDALLTASRLLVAISARSIADLDETITIAQLRTLAHDPGASTRPS